MSEFSVKIERITVDKHPNADALEIAKIKGYEAIVAKGVHKTGDLVAYIPEQAVCPQWLIERMNLTGKLAGKDKNRVKAIKLRGIVSQGLVFPLEGQDGFGEFAVLRYTLPNGLEATCPVALGDDVTEMLGVTKYKPAIPAQFAGEVDYKPEYTVKFDVENIKNYPTAIETGRSVIITEKIHGTFCGMTFVPCHDKPYIFSKGLGAKGLCFKFNEANDKNVYIRAYNNLVSEDFNPVECIHSAFPNKQVTLLGEVFGTGVQDLSYGEDGISFRLFGVIVNGEYVKYSELKSLPFDKVPVLYNGPFSMEVLNELTDGKETVSGDETHIREGVVVTPADGNFDELKHPYLKSVSVDYLFRKNGTEYN